MSVIKPIYTHKHHIIPRHAGGTDHPSNLVELTIKEHAQAHLELYEKYKLEKDRIAWLALTGQIGREEARILAIKSPECRAKMSKSRTGDKNHFFGKTHTPENKKKQKERMTGSVGHFKGKKHTQKSNDANALAQKNLPKYPCTHCGQKYIKSHLTRWHNDNCKQKDGK